METLGIPEAERDLSISLKNVAQVAFARSDLTGAEQALSEALVGFERVASTRASVSDRRDLELAKKYLARLKTGIDPWSAPADNGHRAN